MIDRIYLKRTRLQWKKKTNSCVMPKSLWPDDLVPRDGHDSSCHQYTTTFQASHELIEYSRYRSGQHRNNLMAQTLHPWRDRKVGLKNHNNYSLSLGDQQNNLTFLGIKRCTNFKHAFITQSSRPSSGRKKERFFPINTQDPFATLTLVNFHDPFAFANSRDGDSMPHRIHDI